MRGRLRVSLVDQEEQMLRMKALQSLRIILAPLFLCRLLV